MVPSKSLQTFYILIVTQVFSLIGSQMTALAVGIWVFQDSGKATPLAMAAFFSAVPRILASSFAGVLADRRDRRYVMVLADAGQALGTLLLMFSFLSGNFQLWHLYTVSALNAIFGVFQGPAFQASVTMLIPDAQRDRANAIQQLTGPAAGIIAPVLAGLLFAVVDAPGVMAIDLFTFVVAIIVVWLVHIPRPAQTDEGRAAQGTLWQEVQVGFRYLWARRPLFVLLLAATSVNFFFDIVSVLFTPYILSITGSEAALGALSSVMSAGAIVGGVIMSAWGGTRPRVHTIFPGIMVSGLMLALFGIMRAPITMGPVLFMMLLPLPMVNAAFVSILQLKTPPDLQGRVFAAVSQIAMLMTPFALLLSGPLADHIFEPAVGGSGWDLVAPVLGSQVGSGIGLMTIVCGVMVFIATVIFYTKRDVRHLEADLPDFTPVVADVELRELQSDTESEGAEVSAAATPATV